MVPIRIEVGELNLDGELNDTECARQLARALPVRAEFSVWGDELHLAVELSETPRATPDGRVRAGDLGFWSEGSMLCIFFGPTPASPAEEPVSAVPVTVVGRIGEAERLRACKEAGAIAICARNGDDGGADPVDNA